MLKMNYSSNFWDTPICFVLELQEQLSIMLPQGNINLDSSYRKSLSIHVDYILSKQEGIFYMSVKDTTTTGI